MTLEMKTELYPYQEEAVAKMLPLRIGALYMEMGTGKTRVALEMIAQRVKKEKIDQVLWLCPCTVKNDIRKNINQNCSGWESLIRIEGIESLSQSDRLYLSLLKYVTPKTMVVVDESNLVKNFFRIRTKRITEIGKTARYRLILNGTPVSRNEADLYAQWYFLDRRIFGYRTFWSFAANHLEKDEYGRYRRVLNVGYLTEKIKPYSFMKKKDEVLSLPRKHVYRSRFELSEEQNKHYNRVADDMLMQVDEADESTIYRTFTALQLVTSGRRVTQTVKPLKSEPFYKDPYDNPRIKCLLEILPNEKTIIWVKFKHEADEIAHVLPSGSSAIFTGQVNLKQRMKNLERFRTDPECLYLIANKVCGGYGLNLQFCHKAIYYNNDFNYATRAQSEDRIHRIGQEYEVEIDDILSDGRIDERIVDCLDRKENLSEQFKRKLKENRGKEFLK